MIKATQLYRVKSPAWTGTLYLSARPRGGDWLEDEVADWKEQDVDEVISLLTASEEADLDLTNERTEVERNGMQFVSFPIEDRSVPQSIDSLRNLVKATTANLTRGKNVVVHCRQGIGRTGLIAATLLVHAGIRIEDALSLLTAVRGVEVPETPDQKAWLIELSRR